MFVRSVVPATYTVLSCLNASNLPALPVSVATAPAPLSVPALMVPASPAPPAARLFMMTRPLGMSLEEASRAASDPSTDTQTLVTLWENAPPTLLPLLAANPNLPPSLFPLALRACPRETVANPAFDLLLLENPMFLGGLNNGELRDFVTGLGNAWEGFLIPILLQELSQRPEGTRKSLAAHEETSMAILAGLVLDASWDVRRSAGGNPKTPEAARRIFEAETAAQDPQTTRATLKILAENPSVHVRLAVLAHANTPPSLFKSLSCDRDAQVARTASALLQWSLLALRLQSEPDAEERLTAARWTDLDLISLGVLMRDSDPRVRIAVAEHPSVPRRMLEILSKDADPDVRREAARCSQTLR